jgi:hypothetical protein
MVASRTRTSSGITKFLERKSIPPRVKVILIMGGLCRVKLGRVITLTKGELSDYLPYGMSELKISR